MNPALHTTQVPAGSHVQPDPVLPWSHRFFGAVLVGRTPDELPLGVRATLAWAIAEARRCVAAGRATADQEEVLGLRLAYQALKPEAAACSAAGASTHGDLIASVAALRHRQRAAVLLAYGRKMSDADVARVLGVRPVQLQPILACATTAVARRMGRPVDLPRAMRKAARPVPLPAAATQPRVASVVRMPRPSPVQVLIAPTLPPAASEPQPETPSPRSIWSMIGRVAAAATVGMLFAWAIWPVH